VLTYARLTSAAREERARLRFSTRRNDMLVLIVDSELFGALRLTATLEEAGHTVAGPARSSGEGIILARRQQPKAAYVAIDLETEYAGARLAQQLKAELEIPVILTSDHVRIAGDASA
jgi:CheY-like chemotaxis protein